MTDPRANTTAQPRPRGRAGLRFAIAFVAGLLAALALGAGALYGYDRQYDGRVLPGVRVGSVDLSGLTPASARTKLESGYRRLSEGSVVVRAGEREFAIPWSALGRRLETDALVDAAIGIGRSGNAVERVIGEAKTALGGVAMPARVTFDPQALAERIEAAAREVDSAPTDAAVTVGAEGIEVQPGVDGGRADRAAALEAAMAELARTDAPDPIIVDLPIAPVEPDITTAEAEAAAAAAERIAADVDLVAGEEAYTIRASTVRTWLRVARTVDGALAPVVEVTRIPTTVETIAEAVRQSPRSASFTFDGDTITGVTPGQTGRTLEVEPTAKLLGRALAARADDGGAPAVDAAVTITEPPLTTEAAEAAAPEMERISRWTTYFPISEKNGWGANIWIPARDVDGYVVAPGAWFDFWEAVGPVTRERGYQSGAAIINGRTEPQGALAGGICSCSTTLFNAALRAGYEMGDRRNHYYYIDRYPVGLDATVFKSSSGSVQTMSWRNDTPYPVLVRGYQIRDGNDGYVRFDLWSVPTGREVSLSEPTIRNVHQATDTTEYTDTLPAGQTKRIEYPVDGMDVWVSRTVRDADGKVLHEDTFRSKYATITGITLVGTG